VPANSCHVPLIIFSSNQIREEMAEDYPGTQAKYGPLTHQIGSPFIRRVVMSDAAPGAY